jgi:hypothetical protein
MNLPDIGLVYSNDFWIPGTLAVVRDEQRRPQNN